MKPTRNYKKFAAVFILLWAVVLAGGAAISGNQATITPDFSQYEATVIDKRISSNSLNCKINGDTRSKIYVIEFDQSGICSSSLNDLKRYACYDTDNLEDLKWIRKKFKKLDRQMIVYSSDADQNLYASSLLTHYGYKVRMLEDTVNLHQSEPELEQAAPQVTQNSSPIVPVITDSDQVESEEMEEEEEEEEEEGC